MVPALDQARSSAAWPRLALRLGDVRRVELRAASARARCAGGRGYGRPGPRRGGRAHARRAVRRCSPIHAGPRTHWRSSRPKRAPRDAELLGLDDGLAAHPDGVTGVAAVEVHQRERHRRAARPRHSCRCAIRPGCQHLLADLDRARERWPESRRHRTSAIALLIAQQPALLGPETRASSSRMASSRLPWPSTARAIR